MIFYYGDLYGNLIYGGKDEDEKEPIADWGETSVVTSGDPDS